MLPLFSTLRSLNLLSLLARLLLAMLCGGLIGMERGRKLQAAGFRTYMLVCMGATLTMMLGEYNLLMINQNWQSITPNNLSIDVARFGAQVIKGIGFLGAGTILITGRQQVKGLTTAAGLWSSACMGLAIGAGFYEGVLLGFLLIFFSITALPYFESLVVEKSVFINIYIEIDSIEDLRRIINYIKLRDIRILDIDIERNSKNKKKLTNVIFSLQLPKPQSHNKILAYIAELDCIHIIEEI